VIVPVRNPTSKVRNLAAENQASVMNPISIEDKIIGKTLDWFHNGQDKNGDLEIRGDGSCTGCGAEGTWYLIDT